MKNRIEVNGIWYVRETLTTPTKKRELNCSVEAEILGDNIFNFSALMNENGTFSMPSLAYKHKDEDELEWWDNPDFLQSLAADGTHEEVKLLDKDTVADAVWLLREVQKKGWL